MRRSYAPPAVYATFHLRGLMKPEGLERFMGEARKGDLDGMVVLAHIFAGRVTELIEDEFIVATDSNGDIHCINKQEAVKIAMALHAERNDTIN